MSHLIVTRDGPRRLGWRQCRMACQEVRRAQLCSHPGGTREALDLLFPVLGIFEENGQNGGKGQMKTLIYEGFYRRPVVEPASEVVDRSPSRGWRGSKGLRAVRTDEQLYREERRTGPLSRTDQRLPTRGW